MAFHWAQGSIAGVSLSQNGDPCRCVVLDGARTQSRRFVNQRASADGTIYTQGLDTEGRNARFGVRFDHIPIDILQAIIDSINTAIDSQDGFSVELEDDFHALSVTCTVDGSEWLSYPDQITNDQTFATVVMRFVTIG